MQYTDLRDQLLARFSKYSQDIMELTKMASKIKIVSTKMWTEIRKGKCLDEKNPLAHFGGGHGGRTADRLGPGL